MSPEEIANAFGLDVNENELYGEIHFHARFSSWLDLDAFIDLCQEESDKNVVPVCYNNGSGEAHWMYYEGEMK